MNRFHDTCDKGVVHELLFFHGGQWRFGEMQIDGQVVVLFGYFTTWSQ